MLEAGGKVVLAETKASLSRVLKNDPKRQTGQLKDSLGLSPVLQNKSGQSNIKVGFAEPRRDGKSNAMVANTIEYGKSGQAPKPFIAPAKRKSKAAALKAMEDTFNREVKL